MASLWRVPIYDMGEHIQERGRSAIVFGALHRPLCRPLVRYPSSPKSEYGDVDSSPRSSNNRWRNALVISRFLLRRRGVLAEEWLRPPKHCGGGVVRNYLTGYSGYMALVRNDRVGFDYSILE